MTNDEKMRVTISVAKEAILKGEMPISACVFLKDEIVSKAYTTEKTEQRLLVHAELNALMIADTKRLSIHERKQAQLFTTLEPCLMCYGSAMSAYIGTICFSLKAPSDGAMDLIRFDQFNSDYIKHQKPIVESGILVAETKALFEDYLLTLEKDSYLYDFTRSILTGN